MRNVADAGGDDSATALAFVGRRMRSSAAKRIFDIVVASAAVAVLGVAMGVIAIVVRMRMGSPILHRSVRPGLDGRPFTMLKFRTMRGVTGIDGELLPDRDRITTLGRILRRTSLDELPELFNVLRGEMSLVGPRPLLMSYLPLYSAEQARRHDVRPGMTGWAQINGRNSLDWDRKLELDVWYVDHRSLALDVRILWRTVGKVLRRDGMSAEGDLDVPPFAGSVRREERGARGPTHFHPNGSTHAPAGAGASSVHRDQLSSGAGR